MTDITITTASGQQLCLRAEVADSFFKRFLGLMGRPDLPKGTGMVIYPCSSIHMMFMRFPIDAVFFDKKNQIVKIAHRLKPWTGFSIAYGAYGVLELPAGTLDDIDLSVDACWLSFDGIHLA